MDSRYAWMTVLFLLLFAAACSGSPETQESVPTESNPTPTVQEATPTPEVVEEAETISAQEQTLIEISDAAGFEPELVLEGGLPRFIAPYLQTQDENPESAARIFFEDYADLYGVQNPGESLQLDQIQETGTETLVRFQQILQGYPVYGGQAIVAVSPGGLISFVNSALQPTTTISDQPSIPQEQAVEAAVQFSADDQASLAREPQLVVFSPLVMNLDQSEPLLAWEIGLNVDQGEGGPPLLIQYLVDAVQGEVVFEALEDLGAENWNLYSAENNSTPSPVTWYEVSSGEVTAATGPDGQALADEEGETARDNMELTWDYFFNTHGWDGHDDNGGTCSITVHVGSGWKNASCNAACDCRFGDGGGGWGSFLDVLAHEYGHAVVGQSAGLNYTYLSGAVNEHYADFFAAMIEPSDWLISYPIGFRDLSDPPNGSNESPDHYDELLTVSVPASGNDYGYVHFNSGIPNKASFMVADTGTNVHPDSGVEVEGLGRSITERIWFDTLLSLGPSTSLKTWAASTVGTAHSLVPDSLTEEQACQVQYAMQAVGLREPDCRCNDEEQCPLSGISSTSQEGETGETETEDTQVVVTACDHPMLPVRIGSSWTYRDSEGYTAVYTVKDVTGDEDYAEAMVEAVLTGGGESLNMNSTWTCDQEGIRAPITSFSSLPNGIETSVASKEQGVFLPPTNALDFGSRWTYGTTFEMDITSPDAGTIQATNERSETFTSEKMTDLTVPAGSFEVLEISGSYTVNVTLMGGAPREFPGTEVLWFAEGIGLVKNQVDQQGVYTLELVDYTIPE